MGADGKPRQPGGFQLRVAKLQARVRELEAHILEERQRQSDAEQEQITAERRAAQLQAQGDQLQQRLRGHGDTGGQRLEERMTRILRGPPEWDR